MKALKKFVNELNTKGAKIKAYQSDASSYEKAEELVKAVLNDFGKVDVLINNAGTTRDTLMLRMSEDQWDDVINTNLSNSFESGGGCDVARLMVITANK